MINRALHSLASSALVRVLLTVTVLALAGCGLLETRDPEDPVGNAATADLALSPDEALAQLELALSLHDPTLYMAAISDSFSVSTTPSAFPDDPFFFEDWNATREDAFVRSLLAPALLPPDSTARLVFTPVEEIVYADSAVYRENYTLRINSVDPELPRDYEGLADLIIRREEDGGWRVVHWLDQGSGEAPAISQLRAAL